MGQRYEAQNAKLRQLLTQLRLKKGLTQTQLANHISRRQNYISNYERGERKLEVFELLEILKILDTDAGDILKEIENTYE